MNALSVVIFAAVVALFATLIISPFAKIILAMANTLP